MTFVEREKRVLLIKFPTVYRPAKVSEIQDGDSVKVAGEDYTVGERALEGGIPVRDVKSLVRAYPILVAEAKKRTGWDGGVVSVSLPVEVLRSDLRKGKELISTLQREITEKVEKVEGVEVLPQGIAGFVYAESQGLLEERPTLIIDGGFNTINVSLIEPDGRGDYKVIVGVSLMDSGVRRLLNTYFKESVRDAYPDLPTDEQILNQLFLKKRMRIAGKVVDVTEQVEEAKAKYLASFFPKVEAAISSSTLTADYEQILVIGGISYYLDENSVKNTDFGEGTTVVVPDENGEYYNALGIAVLTGSGALNVDGGFGHTKVCVL